MRNPKDYTFLTSRKSKNSISIFIVMGTIASLLSGCGGPGQTFGQVGGGVVGGLLGSMVGKGRGRLVATAVGAVLGSMAGGAFGQQFDEKDKNLANRAADDCLATGQTSSWSNPNTGHSGQFIPEPARYNSAGRKCRKVKMLVYSADGQPMEVYQYAEQGADGRWYMVH